MWEWITSIDVWIWGTSIPLGMVFAFFGIQAVFSNTEGELEGWQYWLIYLGIAILLMLTFIVLFGAISTVTREQEEESQQVVSHFIEDVHGGRLDNNSWRLVRTLGGRIIPLPTERVWMELLVWLSHQEYDITFNQVRGMVERGRISIEPYVNISGLREVLNE